MIRLAIINDLKRLCEIDKISHNNQSRRDFIRVKVDAGECYVITDDDMIVGYGVFNYSFFGCGFIELLYIDEKFRHKGYGRELLHYFESICTHLKLFTSTNESNVIVQSLLESEGYIKSGVIYNLDEEDPEIIYYKYIKR